MERLVRLFAAAGVTCVADVRSHPYSQRHPHFNRPDLDAELALHGIRYVFLGDCLGGRPDEDAVYEADGRVDYERVRATAAFQRGLDRLVEHARASAVVMLCAEEDPLDCHRGLMITPALVGRGIAPLHLRGDGSAEATAAMEARLLAETRVGAGIVDGLFAGVLSADDRRELLAAAYRLMGRRKAFQRRREAEGAGDVG
jgi:uncharacterized protein (DUF488 family)